MGPVELEGQLPVRLHRQRVRRRVQAQRHPAVADRPGPQHPRRRALHAVPGVRLRRRRQGRGRDEDRRRHRSTAPARSSATSSADYRNSAGYVLSGPEYLTMFNGQTGAAMSTVNYVPAARHRLVVGRPLRQPGRPVPGRHRLPRRAAAQPDHVPRLLHPYRHRGLGLPQRHADPSAGRSTPTASGIAVHRAGQPPAGHRRRRRRRPGRDRLRRDGHRRQRRTRCGTPATATATRCTSATSIPSRPGLEVFKVDENTSKPAAWMADARTGQILWQHASCGCDNGRGVSDDIWAGSPGAESWSSAVTGLRQHQRRRPSAASPARRTSSPGGTATRSANCSTARTSTSTAPAATPAC